MIRVDSKSSSQQIVVKSFDTKDYCQALLIQLSARLAKVIWKQKLLDVLTHPLACGTKQHPPHKVTHHMKEIVVCLHQNVPVPWKKPAVSWLHQRLPVVLFPIAILHSCVVGCTVVPKQLTNLTKTCCNSLTCPRRTSAVKHCGEQVHLQ